MFFLHDCLFNLGKGHFGTVYHGEYITNKVDPDGNPIQKKVAIKTLSRIEDMDAIEGFLREGKF